MENTRIRYRHPRDLISKGVNCSVKPKNGSFNQEVSFTVSRFEIFNIIKTYQRIEHANHAPLYREG